jgi:glycolate oxidase FAD binding subunit
MKNVTGLDLIKLLAGSWGTLAPMTEVTFKVVPQVETEATLALLGLSDEKASQAMAAAMATSCEVTGASHLPKSAAGYFKEFADKSATLLRLEGFEKSVNLRIEKLQTVLAGFGEHLVLANEQTKSIWSAIRDVKPLSDDIQKPVWRISVAPMVGHKLIAELGAEDVFYDWQGGLVWLRMDDLYDADRIRSKIVDLGGGHATLVRASAEQRQSEAIFQPENAAVAAISKRIREQFDPSGKFYSGRMG